MACRVGHRQGTKDSSHISACDRPQGVQCSTQAQTTQQEKMMCLSLERRTFWIFLGMAIVNISDKKNPALAFAMEKSRKQRLGLTRHTCDSGLAHDGPKFVFREALEASTGPRSTLVLGP